MEHSLEAHLRPLEKELKNYWKLGDTKLPPKGILGLREQFIYNDLKLMHKIWSGRSTIDLTNFSPSVISKEELSKK